MERIPDPRRASALKKLEWFFSGIVRLGQTYRLAKITRRAVEEDAQRLAAVEEDVAARVDMLGRAFDRRLYGLSAEIDGKLEAVGARATEDAAQRADAARDALGHRLGTIDTRAAAVEDTVAAIASRIDAAMARSDAVARDLVDRTERQIAPRLSRLEGVLGIDPGADGRTGTRLERIEARVEALAARLAEAQARSAAEQALAARGLTDLGRRLDLARRTPPPAPEPREGRALAEDGLEALLDAFYNRLEDRFRGSREEIMRRLAVYLPAAEAAVERTGGTVLDLGCGRGEWLQLLGTRGLAARGVELNPVQAEEARAEGLDVVEGDACEHLAGLPDGCLAMITMHHVVEHLPFPTVAWIAREAMAKLAPGGLLLFETPNPNSLLVGARSFHMDPTHLRPLPAEVLSTLMDTVGFHPVETRFMHPHEKLDVFNRERRLDPEIAGLIFGPQDLAVTGTRPDPADAATDA